MLLLSQNLPPHEKGVYKARAKEHKIKAQGNVTKRNAIGESLISLELQEKKEQEFRKNMIKYIESVVSLGILHNSKYSILNLMNFSCLKYQSIVQRLTLSFIIDLPKLKFLFIHANWFCKRDIGINQYEFFPAEFAIAEFSLENGIEDVYHELLKANLPLGWKREAMEISQQTHQIPIDLEDGKRDYSVMYDNFTRFLDARKTGNKYPPLFTLKDSYPIIESLLTKLVDDGSKYKDLINNIEIKELKRYYSNL